MLETYFLKADNEFGYIKVITHTINWLYFEKLGFKRTTEEALATIGGVTIVNTKNEIIEFGLKLGLTLDPQKTKATLISEIEALDNGNS